MYSYIGLTAESLGKPARSTPIQHPYLRVTGGFLSNAESGYSSLINNADFFFTSELVSCFLFSPLNGYYVHFLIRHEKNKEHQWSAVSNNAVMGEGEEIIYCTLHPRLSGKN